MPIIEAGGIELHYLERGSGPPLLLIAGIPAVADDWDPLARALAPSTARDRL